MLLHQAFNIDFDIIDHFWTYSIHNIYSCILLNSIKEVFKT